MEYDNNRKNLLHFTMGGVHSKVCRLRFIVGFNIYYCAFILVHYKREPITNITFEHS